MTNEEVLEKAIQKAIDGGWITISDDWYLRGNGVYFRGDATGIRFSYPDIIFNHDFAKALWGEEDSSTWKIPAGVTVIPMKHWQAMLQQMVIADDPIAYLGANL